MTTDMQRLDASETIFLKRQLESVDKTAYAKIYPENVGRSLIPTVMDVAETAPTYTWYATRRFGRAKIGGALGDDAPRVDVDAKPQSQVITNITDSYEYTVLEIREANRTGTNLDQVRAIAARDTIETAIDEILATGNTGAGLYGLFNMPSVGLYTLGTKSGGGTAWSAATPDEIVRDVFDMASTIIDNLKHAGGDAMHSFTLVLPVRQYTLIAQNRMGDCSDKTILKFILENSPFIKAVVPWHRAAGAGASGADRAVMYVNDAKVLGALVPMEFTPSAPQARNLSYVVTCMARCGGVVCRYPVACLYADGL